MAREKVTVTLDRSKAERARDLVAASTTSEVIDIALTQLIRRERTARDAALYLTAPETEEELAIARFSDAALADGTDLADDTDWEALYADVLK